MRSAKSPAGSLYVVPPPAPAKYSAPSLRLCALGSRNSPMSTTLRWVWGVWYMSPTKFSQPIFQLARTRQRCGPRSSRPAGLWRV